jgi:hypothetical protein
VYLHTLVAVPEASKMVGERWRLAMGNSSGPTAHGTTGSSVALLQSRQPVMARANDHEHQMQEPHQADSGTWYVTAIQLRCTSMSVE